MNSTLYLEEVIERGVLEAQIEILNMSMAFFEKMAPACELAQELLDDRYGDLYAFTFNFEKLNGEHDWDACYGSEDEWNALSLEERSKQWGRFNELCAQGIADDMYYYKVMMAKHLVDYVGH